MAYQLRIFSGHCPQIVLGVVLKFSGERESNFFCLNRVPTSRDDADAGVPSSTHISGQMESGEFFKGKIV